MNTMLAYHLHVWQKCKRFCRTIFYLCMTSISQVHLTLPCLHIHNAALQRCLIFCLIQSRYTLLDHLVKIKKRKKRLQKNKCSHHRTGKLQHIARLFLGFRTALMFLHLHIYYVVFFLLLIMFVIYKNRWISVTCGKVPLPEPENEDSAHGSRKAFAGSVYC